MVTLTLDGVPSALVKPLLESIVCPTTPDHKSDLTLTLTLTLALALALTLAQILRLSLQLAFSGACCW